MFFSNLENLLREKQLCVNSDSLRKAEKLVSSLQCTCTFVFMICARILCCYDLLLPLTFVLQVD